MKGPLRLMRAPGLPEPPLNSNPGYAEPSENIIVFVQVYSMNFITLLTYSQIDCDGYTLCMRSRRTNGCIWPL